MSDGEYAFLEFIRHSMKAIIKHEQGPEKDKK